MQLLDLTERELAALIGGLALVAAALLLTARRLTRDTAQEAPWTTGWSPTATATPT